MTRALAALGLASEPNRNRIGNRQRRRPPGVLSRIGLAAVRHAPAIAPTTWTVRAGDVRPGDVIARAGKVLDVKQGRGRVRLCVDAGEVIRRPDDPVTLRCPF